jgi:hypothetical protein
MLDQRYNEPGQAERSDVVAAMSDRGMGVAHCRGGNLRVEPIAHEQHLEAPGKIAVREAVIGLESEGTFECVSRLSGRLQHPIGFDLADRAQARIRVAAIEHVGAPTRARGG